MIILNCISQIKFKSLFFKLIRPYHVNFIHDKYFRNKSDYKNSLIQLNDDYKENKLAGPGMSFIINKADVQANEFFSHLSQRENVMKLSASQLKDAMYLMVNSRIDSVKYEDALKFVDEKCALSVDRWPLNLSIYILDAWFIILGPKVYRNHYYCALSNLLNRKMKKCSKHNLILVLYFVGMSKKSPPFLMELIEYRMEHFVSDFTDEEWAIACLSFFKTSTKINSDVLLKNCCKAAENFMLKNDRFNLISVLKCLRLSGYFDENLMRLLDDYIKKEYKTFNFVECTNFLASFATQNMYNYEIYNCLENQGISCLSKEDITENFTKDIEKIHPSERSRGKDLARFLWGMAFVGHNINHMSLNFVDDLLSARVKSGEFNSKLPTLIDCVQSLILLGHYPLNMIEYILNPFSLQKISNIEKAKPKYQLYFISRSAYIENCVAEIKSKKFISNIPKNLEKEIIEREGFLDLIDYLKVNLKENSFTSCYIMPHIMISGIIVATDRKENNSDNVTSVLLKLVENGIISRAVEKLLHEDKIYTCIEILDPSVCVHGSTMPLGLLKTKIRHLQKFNINVVTLSPEEINALKKLGRQNCGKLQDIIM